MEIFSILLSLLFPEEVYTNEYIIKLDQTPLNIYWISEDNILLSYLNYSEIFNIESRSRNKLEDCTNCIYGYDREILRCEYEHREIHRIDEYSTTVYIFNSSNKLLYTKDIFETVAPVVCMKEYLLLRNAYSFLEETEYLLNTKTGNVTKLDMILERNIFRNNKKKIFLTKKLLNILSILPNPLVIHNI